MKILYITNGYPPHRWAGTETYTNGVAEEAAKRGHNVQVLCLGEWDKGTKYWNGVSEDIHNGIPVRRINLNWTKSPDPFRYVYDNPVVAKYLTNYLREGEFDLVHVTSCETLSACVIPVVKNAGLPLILSLTDFWFLCPTTNLLKSNGANCSGVTTPWDCLQCMARGSKVYRWSQRILPGKGAETLLTKLSYIPLVTRQRGFRGMLGDMADRKQFLRRIFSLPDIRLVASKFVRDVFIQNGFDDPVRLHPYGHDLSWLKDSQSQAHSNSLAVGFIGQIVASKGIHLLLEAARQLTTPLDKKVKFLIYGNLSKAPEYAQHLKELADGSSAIQFCGTYPHEMSAEVFSKVDVLAVPSLWYDFPLIIHEAFATKTPVIATNLGGMAEVVSHEVNGLLFERGNVEDLVHQIKRLVSEPGLMQTLKAGIPQVKRISEEVDELDEIYMGLFQRQARSIR